MFLNYYKDTFFLTSIVNVGQLLTVGKEIAFIGYSNVGKSSVINMLTEKRGLSKISKTPGRTQMINIFEISTGYRLIDLPGYGYAKVSKENKMNLNLLLNQYLLHSICLIGVFVCMDIRHVIKELDKKFLHILIQKKISICIILTKSDKLNQDKKKKRYR
ncbi:ribosome biogenesis GTP-binding protein YihA/YsxC [Buchnera aphidicola]|uniref:ribosome biogenesis GTP-binding protein YihA/YsxC n=1 Tax=Buchnera aphidicola TaxID=9 RepID=UPI003464826D